MLRFAYRAVIALGVFAVLLGLWDLLIERDGGASDTLFDTVLPGTLLTLVVIVLYRRRFPRQPTSPEPPPETPTTG